MVFNMWIEKEICIAEVETLLKDGYEIEVDSPDGYVPISKFVDKGEWEEYCLMLSDGRVVRVNENHLFETTLGWKSAKELYNNSIKLVCDAIPEYICDDGIKPGKIVKSGNTIPIVDIQVDHENHRYYTNGVSSHNTGVGKSLFMSHVAASCLMQNYSVLYITLEMSEEKIAERIDANLMNVTMDDLKMMPKEMFDKRIDKFRQKVKGKLIIKEYPTASAHSGHFRALLNELRLKKAFKPDIIFIDYLNICASARIKGGANVNSYTYIKAIAEELRGLAVENNVPIVSATQINRSGFSDSDPGLENTSESFGLPATADLMFALISTEELEQLNQIMVKQLKNRYGDISTPKRFTIGIDRPKMKLYDLEEKAQDLIQTTSTPDKQNKFDKFKKLKV